ncbi:MAG: copper resistance protein CopC [Gammaproteobacteria bacterium]|nr:copper resistance protein CopC [Gammaproteobacteria bacterium]
MLMHPMSRILTSLLCTALLVWSGAAAAHAKLVRAKPAAEAELGASPKAVTLWFNETPEADFSNVKVLDAAGQVMAEGAPVPTKDQKALELTLSATLPPGRYTVRYRVIAVDGHVLEGSFTFRVGSAAAQ